MMSPAVFLDKDGTLIENVPYNVDPALIRLTPNADAGLRLLRDAGYRLVVISNQSGIARGYFEEDALGPVREKLAELLSELGVKLDGFYYCPHHPKGVVAELSIECDCRKPRAGLLLLAARDLNVDLARSWLIGDILDDVEAGNDAGCRTVLIDSGSETEWRVTPSRWPSHIARDLARAAEHILARAEVGCR